MRVKGEGFSQASSSHRDKGHGIDEAQQPLTAREQQIEPCLVERLVYPDHLDERREIGTKGSDRVQTKPPADECVSFNKNERRRDERILPCAKGCERALGSSVVLVLRVEQREQTGRVCEDGAHSYVSAR